MIVSKKVMIPIVIVLIVIVILVMCFTIQFTIFNIDFNSVENITIRSGNTGADVQLSSTQCKEIVDILNRMKVSNSANLISSDGWSYMIIIKLKDGDTISFDNTGDYVQKSASTKKNKTVRINKKHAEELNDYISKICD